MDVIQLHAAAASLEPRFRGRRLQAVTGADAAPELRFGDRLSLCLSLTGRFRGLLPLGEASGQETGESFVPYLHQRLVGFHLEAIQRPWPDRVLLLPFARKRLTGRYDRRYLVAELLGNRCNAALLTDDHRIDRALHRPSLTDRDARFFPGLAYRPPEAPEAADSAWSLLDGPPPEGVELSGPKAELVRRVAPLPPRLAQALEGLDEGDRRELLSRAAQSLVQPTAQWFLHGEADKAFLYPFPLPNWEAPEPAGPLDEAWSHYLESALHRAQAEHHSQRLAGRLRRIRKRLEERLEKIAADEARHAHPEEYRRLGQALAGLGSGLARGETVTATDYLANPPTTIGVPVRPGTPFQEEAQRYFNRARKAERGQELAARRRFETEADLAEVARLEADLAEADDATRQAIADRLEQLEGIPPEQRHGTRQRPPEGPKPPREYRHRGHTILVGTSRTSNDWLTFRRARPWDIWLHVQGLPGAHVVIPRERKDPLPHDETLDYAARLAVSHSPQADRKAEVDWTEVKHVRRHPNGKPGQALYEHFKTRIAEALPEPTGTEPDG